MREKKKLQNNTNAAVYNIHSATVHYDTDTNNDMRVRRGTYLPVVYSVSRKNNDPRNFRLWKKKKRKNNPAYL